MAENQVIKNRILSILKTLNISQGTFEKECGLANGWVSSIKKSISTESIQRILDKHPEISPAWLVTGEGEMLRGVTQAIGDNSSHNTQSIGAQCATCPITAQLVEKDRQIAKLQDTIDKLMEKI